MPIVSPRYTFPALEILAPAVASTLQAHRPSKASAMPGACLSESWHSTRCGRATVLDVEILVALLCSVWMLLLLFAPLGLDVPLAAYQCCHASRARRPAFRPASAKLVARLLPNALFLRAVIKTRARATRLQVELEASPLGQA